MEFGNVRCHPNKLLRLLQLNHMNNQVLKLLKLIQTSHKETQMIFENFNFLKICNFIMTIGP
jgi:hypothetical protein